MATRPVHMTAAGRSALEAELAELENVRRPEIVARIASTRAEGDLSENAGYHQAREDQSHVEGRIAELRAALRDAVIIEEGAPDGVARIGARVTVEDQWGRSTYFIVGPTEVDAAAGRISAQSPIGSALIGKRAGDVAKVAAPAGETTLKVVEVS
ncbi:MAG TPA: transcription elongation factor GreA [Candidatus Dormibacteraeota bacterium]|nr:transcription elongation factor GreA [Candidatus Dormibacteraeota bacterium]